MEAEEDDELREAFEVGTLKYRMEHMDVDRWLARIFHTTPRHEPVEVDFGDLVAGAVRFDSFAQTLECNRS
jgi:hypothetical protein